MHCHRLGLCVLSILATALLPGLTTPVAPPWDDLHVKHAWNAVPANWESLGPPPAGTVINLHVALKPHNENALIDALYEVSTPSHHKYGAHLSKEEVAKLVAPHPNTLELVHSWLGYHGVPPSSISTTHGGAWLTLTGVPVSQANKLLSASYQFYRYAGTNDSTILRTVGYALPAVLHTHVQTVAPTTYFASMSTFLQTPRRSSIGAAAALEKAGWREPATVMASRQFTPRVTPAFLRWLYQTSTYVPTATGQNTLGVAGFLNNVPSPTDQTTFMDIFRSEAVTAEFTLERANGGRSIPNFPHDQANINMQYAQAMAFPTPHIFYITGGKPRWTGTSSQPSPHDVWLGWLDYMLVKNTLPQTISTWYGQNENTIPQEYAVPLCRLFAQLGARGVSVLFSSGDDGVGRGDCKVDEGSDSERVLFAPVFPASCPWVTSVGGTTSHFPEVAASLSGGGFSNHFARPMYQMDAVPDFLRPFGSKYRGSYNPIGRGIPDLSAQALNYLFVIEEGVDEINGTSCAVPTVAGIISLLNDYLISKRKRPLGFINPWLYSDGLAGLNDIRYGSNPGCGTDGFSATIGWDPVTGLGTPVFAELQRILYLTKIDPGNRRAFSKPLNNSDTPVPPPRHVGTDQSETPGT